MTALIALYTEWLESMPLLVKSISAGILLGVGDYVSQKYENKREIDVGRLLRVMLFASLLGAPVLHIWYGLLDSLWPGQNAQNIIIKLLLDQCLFTPLSIVLFFSLLGIGEGKSMKEVGSDLRINFLPTLKTSLTIWPLASFVNFCFIDARYRLVFIGCVSIFWNSYLSSVKHQTQGPILPVVSGKVATT